MYKYDYTRINKKAYLQKYCLIVYIIHNIILIHFIDNFLIICKIRKRKIERSGEIKLYCNTYN